MLVLNQNIEDYKSRSARFDSQQQEDRIRLESQIKAADDALTELSKNTIEKNTELISKYEAASKKLFDAKLKLNEQIASANLHITTMKQEMQHNKRVRADRKQIIDKHAELLSRLCDDSKKVFDKYHNLSSYKKDIDAVDKSNEKLEADTAS